MRYIERKKSNIEILLNLIKENPELDIVPMVDNEICQGDDFGYWMGEWGSAELDEVYHHEERIYFRSDDEEELIQERGDFIFINEYPNHKYLSDKESELVNKRAEEYVNSLPWEKVIAVTINLP